MALLPSLHQDMILLRHFPVITLSFKGQLPIKNLFTVSGFLYSADLINHNEMQR